MSKKKKIIILLFIFVVLISYLFLNQSFKNRIKIKEDYKFIRIKYLVMKKSDKDYKIKDVFPGHYDDYQYFTEMYVGLTKKDGYYVTNLKNQANEKILNSIVDYEFAHNNVFAEMIDDCEFNKKTLEIKIPEKYFTKKEKEKEDDVEVELMSRLSEADLNSLELKTKYKHYSAKENKIIRRGRSSTFSMDIPRNLDKDSLKVYLNDNIVLKKSYYDYNSYSGKLTINVSPILINNIYVESPNPISTLFNIQNVEAGANVISNTSGEIVEFEIETLSEAPPAGQGGASGHKSFGTYLWSERTGDDWTGYNIYDNPTVATGTNIGSYQAPNIGALHDNSSISNAKNVIVGITPDGSSNFPFKAKGNTPSTIYVPGNCAHVTNPYGENGGAVHGSYDYWWSVIDLGEENGIVHFTVAFIMNADQHYWTGTGTGNTVQTVVTQMRFYYTKNYCATIHKEDAISNDSLSGVDFSLYSDSSCSNKIDDGTTDSSGFITWDNITTGNGSYWVKETSAKSGYENNNSGCNAIEASSSSCPINIFRDYKDYYCAKVRKVDSDSTNILLNNASFTAYKGSTNVGSGITGGPISHYTMGVVSGTAPQGGYFIVDLLPSGNYKFTETNSDGDILVNANNSNQKWRYNKTTTTTSEVTAVKMTRSGSTYTCPTGTSGSVTASNYKQYGCFKIKKTNQSGTLLPGSKFSTTINGSTVEHADNWDGSNDGYVTFFTGGITGANLRTYSVTETGAPDGYVSSGTSVSVTEVILPKNLSSSAAEAECKKAEGTTINGGKIKDSSGTVTATNKKHLINWYKETENGTAVNGAKFTVSKTVSGATKYVKAKSSFETWTDENSKSKKCYVFDSLVDSESQATQFESMNTLSNGNNSNGETCIIGFDTNDSLGSYTVTETKAVEYHTFDNKKSIPVSTGVNFVAKSSSNKFVNYPTMFEFEKKVPASQDQGSWTSETWLATTTSELKKIPFNIYSGNTVLQFIKTGDGQYEYNGNSIDKPTGTPVTDLYIGNNRKILIKHLAKGTYQIKEKTTDTCTDSKGNSCFGTGYYYPSGSTNFTINDCSNASANASSCSTHATVTQSITNDPTEIQFTKNDIYSYYNASDKVKFEDSSEISAFDKIKFRLKDDKGNYLKLVKIRDVGTCTNSSTDYSLYRYVPSDTSSGVTDLYTCGGNIRITDLCRGRSYTIEEIEVPNNTVFTLPTPHPTVTFNVPQEKPISSNKGVISDTPTRYVVVKLDSKTNEIVPDDTTVYNVYQCPMSVEHCTKDNGTIVNFANRAVIPNDNEDSGKEVYKYSKLNANGKKDLNPFKGELILRYLPIGYKYVVYEKNSPDGYYQPAEGRDYEEFVIDANHVNGTSVFKYITNEYTELYFEKGDIYKYYSKTDKAKLEEDTKLLDTAKFVLRDKNGNIMRLKKVQDGEYRYNTVDSNNTHEEINTYNGSLTITHLNKEETYYIEEVKTTTPANFALPTNVPAPSDKPSNWDWKGHPYVKYTFPKYKPTNVGEYAQLIRMIDNTPSRVVFIKIDANTGEKVIDDQMTFEVYQCPNTATVCTKETGTLINFTPRAEIVETENVDSGKEVYKYSKLNEATNVTSLSPYEGELIIRYLPADYKYVLVETTAPHGYYQPNDEDRETQFVINSSTIINNNNVPNDPTEISFMKSDLFDYYTSDDINTENGTVKLFDTAKFVLRDDQGRVLKVDSTSEPGIYNYSSLCTGSISDCAIQTHNGELKIRYLERGTLAKAKRYYIEEIETTNPSQFTLPTNIPKDASIPEGWYWEGHPYVTYDVPAIYVPTANVIQVMDNEATRVAIRKVNRDNYNEEIDDEKTTFKIYQCRSENECSDSDDRTLIRFTERTTVDGEEAYKYSKLNAGTVKDLHPYQGKLVLRYLPANYHYVAVETVAPDGYYNPIVTDTYFTVGLNTTDDIIINNTDVPNDPTKIYFNKIDIYNYYTAEDRAAMDSDEKLLDTAKFVLRDENGHIVRLKKVTDGEYRYIPVNNDNTYEEINTYNGSLKITHLYRQKRYYIEEVKTTEPGNFILPTTIAKPDGIPEDWNWAGHPYVTYDVPENLPSNQSDVTELISNKPTRVAFAKIDANTKEVIDDESTTFNVYKCNNDTCTDRTIINFTPKAEIPGDQEDPGRKVYKYSKLNASNTTNLNPDKGYLVLRYLPTGDYVLVETVAPDGYYNPTTGINDETRFTVTGSSYSSDKDFEELTDNIENTPTEIIFKKNDFFKYYTVEDQATLESTDKLFDTAKFVLRDENGNILDLKYTETNEENGNIYRYLKVNEDNIYSRINTYKGKLKITNLYRNKVYYIEEVETTSPGNFILPNYLTYDGLPFDNQGHPVVKYTLEDTEPVDKDSITREIENAPTRVKIEKKDSKYNYLIDDEETTFELYQCTGECHPGDYFTIEDREAHGMKIVNFEPRSILETSNGEVDVDSDRGLEVYKYTKLNQNSITSLHPYKGYLILRYLPSGYNYVLLETHSSEGYSLPEGRNAETTFTVSTTTIDVDEVNVPNKPVSLLVRKYAQDGELLEGAVFKLHEATTCNFDIPANEVPITGTMNLKTIRDGVYEARDPGDTNTFRTCQDRPDMPCNSINSTLTYNTDELSYKNTSGDFDNLLNSRNERINIEAGEALIQYLQYGKCYVIEEVKAPKGYSLPEKEEDRFALVRVTDQEQVFDTYEELINSPTPFTFYKMDEYNNPIDGAMFKLQKLNKDKQYVDVPLTRVEKDNGDLFYKVDYSSDNYLMTTRQGEATVYYLEEGQYRIIEVQAPVGYVLPKKTSNVATFFVDENGKVYGSKIIANKPKTDRYQLKPTAKATLVVNIDTGQKIIKYGLIIGSIIVIIFSLIFFQKKKINKKDE